MNFISKMLTLLLVASIFCVGCKTEPKVTEAKVNYKNNDNTVRFRLPSDARFMNPAYMAGYEFVVLEYIFPYLMDFDPETIQMAPLLIKSMPETKEVTHSDGKIDGQAITFELLDEAVWDDGKPVTGYDYAFTIQALFNPKVPSDAITPYLEHVYDVQVDSDNPKRFTILTREKYILAEATVGNMMILPKHIYDPTGLMDGVSIPDLTDPEKVEALAKNNPKIDEFAKQFTSTKFNREVVSGCGPYKFVEWVDKQKIVLAKKENWWGDKLASKNNMLEAAPDTIIFMPIRDDNAVVAAIKGEDLDAVASINSNLFNDLKSNEEVAEKYNFYNPETFNFFYTILNRKSPKLADKRVRRALAHLLEIDKLVEVVYGGYGTPIASPFPPEAPYYRKDLQPIPFDLKKAAELLDEAGWNDTDNDGVRDKEIDGEKVNLSLTYLSTGTLFSKNFAETMKNNGAKVGIEILTEDISFGSILRERLPARDFEMAGMQGAADPLATMDPKQLWHTDSDTPAGSNRSGFGTPETDALIEQIRVTLNDEKRYAMMAQLQEIIYEDQPWLMLFAPQERVVIHKRFEGTPSKVKPTIHPQHLKLKK
jgi:peptide/nickel transport system substrate-binding protein